MKARKIIGLIIFLVGIILLIIGSCVGEKGALIIFLVYGIPFIILGLVIFFNRHEDKIEQVNYSKMKGGKNGKK